jgi:hypothetical protein
MVAHLSNDGLMFIHSKQNRSLAAREASRVQSFPDWFRFRAVRSFRGNRLFHPMSGHIEIRSNPRFIVGSGSGGK